jgi:thiol-disulfide isomerase/thioredoxin
MTDTIVRSDEPRWRDLVDSLDPVDDFNFRHFRMRHMIAELVRSYEGMGIPIGREAPDFTLETTDGRPLHLHELRGRPVLVHFVSYTCPVTRGAVVPMDQLHRQYGDRVQFVDVVVRQAHPGEHHGPYNAFNDKLADAQAYQQEEAISWPVAVDDVDGTVQRAYGGLAAAIYLLDAHGRVAFEALWGQAPPLTDALERLLASNGTTAPNARPVDRLPHLGAAIVVGQRGPCRGGLRSLIDLELGFPGAMLLMTFGWLLRPLVEPLVQRTTPIPVRTRVVLALVVACAIAASIRASRRHAS